MKICNKCRTPKELNEFGTRKKSKDGLQYTCKTCVKQNYLDDKARILINHKMWYDKNKNEVKEYSQNYYRQNAAHLITPATKNYTRRHKEDSGYKLACDLRSRLRSAIKGGFRAGSAVVELGCSVEFFKEYIEEKFSSEMSWGNYGKWHLDHIIPLASFDLSNRKQFVKATHYTNYQPLWTKENLKKGASII